MLKEVHVLLGLLVLSVMVTAARTKPKTKGKDREQLEDPLVPGMAHGLVADGGRTTGREKSYRAQLRKLIKEHRRKLWEGHGEGEMEMLKAEFSARLWMQECASTDGKRMPRMDIHVKTFLKEVGVKVSEFKKMCVGYKKGSGLLGNRGKGKGRGNAKGREKRSYMSAGAGIWDKCIIPYTYSSNLPEGSINAVIEAHEYLEKYTGFRFKYYDGNNTQWGLSHNNFLNYTKGSGCWSFVGNLKGNGQHISPCGGWGVATHEIGHALGLHHEQHTPSSFDMLSTHFDFINYVGGYTRHNLQDVYRQLMFYDMSSIMSYDDWGFRKNYGKTITANEAELDFIIGADNDFYMFEELQIYHNCYDEYPSCATKPTCEMGGYPSVIDGQCSCRCPEGLDPATNCMTKFVPVTPTSWPAGNFTLCRVKDEICPPGMASGHMTRWNKYSAGNGGSAMTPGSVDGVEYGHDMCTQTTSSGSGAWPPGEYCFFRNGGTCPDGFNDGTMELYGQEPKRTNYSYGALPDGEKGQAFEYIYCCRRDGDRKKPISVPIQQPFIWYMANYWGCQQVEGMQAYTEYYDVTRNMDSTVTGKNLTFTGELPHYYMWKSGNFRSYYCVYFPITSDCGEVRTFTTESEYTFTSPGYPSNYPIAKECMWHFKSPEGTTMKIEFTDFEVSHATDTSCGAYLELKTYLPGMKEGFKFCGHGYEKTHETVFNYLTAKFFSPTDTPWKGFSAKITILKAADMCYTGDGKDQSYAGTVNYARSFNPCLPWKDVSHCKVSQFDPKTQDTDLSHNYCRNVITGRMPWCYTNAERCVRENCDACMRDSCYDLFSDCATLKAGDTNFCTKNEHGEAARGCMQACGLCASHTHKPAVSTVTCSEPGDVTSISPTPTKTSYNVGDVVTYKCPTTETVRTRTCTSEGTWTHLGYVCSGCPSGWSSLGGRCYKWLGYTIKQNYAESKASCSALNSTLVVMPTKAVVDGVLALTNYDKEDNPTMWIGLTVDADRKWTWDDGTEVTYAGWHTGEPNDYGGYENCAEGAKDGTWNDIYCNWSSRKRTVVCTYIPTATFVCEDDLPNCEAIVQKTPDMCEEQSDYAWVNCRKTCNVNGCSSTITCADAVADNAQRTHGADTVNQGQYIEYTCNSGYLPTAGDAVRICLPSGLSGTQLTCTAIASVTSYELFASNEIFRRRDQSDAKRAVVGWGSSSSTRISVAGNITAWTFYSNFAGTVTIQVWRPDGTNTSKQDAANFTLVGQNTLTNTLDDRRVTVQIAAGDQIQVQAGDQVGFHMTEYTISYNRCDEGMEPEHCFWYRTKSEYKNVADMTVGTSYSFDADNHSCRIYSIRATVNPSA